MRSIPEWIADHDDQKIPDRVKLRVFERYHGRCYLSGKKIVPGDKWEIEHIKAIALGDGSSDYGHRISSVRFNSIRAAQAAAKFVQESGGKSAIITDIKERA
jgi:hypothetical protein